VSAGWSAAEPVPRRPNYRGRKVAFPLGALLLPAGLAVALAWPWPAGPGRWLVFMAGVGALGLIDDAFGGSPRGWRGHGRALTSGEPSTGAIKAAGTAALAVWAAAGLDLGGAEYVAAAGVLALAAHLGNLLDTRPGRTEKALALALGVLCLATWSLAPLRPIAPLLIPVAAGAWLTLRERAMLGDSGASLIGAMLGVSVVTTVSGPELYLALAGLIAISLYGEFRSISAAIGRVPLLARLDSVGRVN
jgi:UDP-N-acetylmuramyl pentapeptide phosphotransferase/UDP-N-acetylglucosamine-1-phosphate transferase